MRAMRQQVDSDQIYAGVSKVPIRHFLPTIAASLVFFLQIRNFRAPRQQDIKDYVLDICNAFLWTGGCCRPNAELAFLLPWPPAMLWSCSPKASSPSRSVVGRGTPFLETTLKILTVPPLVALSSCSRRR